MTTATQSPPALRTFRLLAGRHFDTHEGKEREFNPGDIVHTFQDLNRKNVRGFPPKFDEVKPDVFDEDAFERMAVERGFVRQSSGVPERPAMKQQDHTEMLAVGKTMAEASGVAQAARQGANLPITPITLTPPKPDMRELEKLPLEKLVKWAEEEEVDLKGVKSKEAALKAIREHLS